MTPATVLDWQRKIVRRRWTYPSRPARPPLPQETIELICRLARENPRWGYLRVVGELKKLGARVSATAMRGVLRRHGLGPAPRQTGPSWAEFLRAQATSMLATDFFHVDTVLGQRFCCLFVIEIGSRVVRLLGTTTNPDGGWMAQMACNLAFELREAGHLLVFSQRQLDRVLRAYVEHYNRARPHRGLQLELPEGAVTRLSVGGVERHDVLGCLIHKFGERPDQVLSPASNSGHPPGWLLLDRSF